VKDYTDLQVLAHCSCHIVLFFPRRLHFNQYWDRAFTNRDVFFVIVLSVVHFFTFVFFCLFVCFQVTKQFWFVWTLFLHCWQTCDILYPLHASWCRSRLSFLGNNFPHSKQSKLSITWMSLITLSKSKCLLTFLTKTSFVFSLISPLSLRCH